MPNIDIIEFKTAKNVWIGNIETLLSQLVNTQNTPYYLSNLMETAHVHF